jgi:hypothetical protein
MPPYHSGLLTDLNYHLLYKKSREKSKHFGDKRDKILKFSIWTNIYGVWNFQSVRSNGKYIFSQLLVIRVNLRYKDFKKKNAVNT